MDLKAAVAQRQQHQLNRDDWAERCIACDEPWPCATWRAARAVVLVTVRRGFVPGAWGPT